MDNQNRIKQAELQHKELNSEIRMLTNCIVAADQLMGIESEYGENHVGNPNVFDLMEMVREVSLDHTVDYEELITLRDDMIDQLNRVKAQREGLRVTYLYLVESAYGRTKDWIRIQLARDDLTVRDKKTLNNCFDMLESDPPMGHLK